jgi:hypothetical protein
MDVVEKRVHVLITHMKDYFLEKRESRILTETEREREKKKKKKKKKREGIHKYTDTQTAVI